MNKILLLLFIPCFAMASSRFSKDVGDNVGVNDSSKSSIAPWCQEIYDNGGTPTQVSAASPLPVSCTFDGTISVVKQGAQDGTAAPWAVAQTTSASATIASVSNSASSFTVAASSASRLGLAVYNNSAVTCYLGYAATTSTSAFTVLLTAGALFQMQGPIYTGIVTGICASASGNLAVTKF